MPTRIGIGEAILDVPLDGDHTPGGAASVYLLEDGTSGYLMEDGTSFYKLESSS